jgi:four helix bundle protein
VRVGLHRTARSFQDLEVYKNLYKAMLIVLTKIIPKLPNEEKFDLGDQMRRACKSPVALIAEGYAKKNYKKDWQKYLNDAIGECNEMIMHLSCCRDAYPSYVNSGFCEELIEIYNASCKQLYRLAESWRAKEQTHNPPPQPYSQLTTHPHNP